MLRHLNPADPVAFERHSGSTPSIYSHRTALLLVLTCAASSIAARAQTLVAQTQGNSGSSRIQVCLVRSPITNTYINRIGGTNAVRGDLYELCQIRHSDERNQWTNVIWRNPQPTPLPGEELVSGGLKANLAINQRGDAIFLMFYEWNWLRVYQIPTNATPAAVGSDLTKGSVTPALRSVDEQTKHRLPEVPRPMLETLGRIHTAAIEYESEDELRVGITNRSSQKRTLHFSFKERTWALAP